MSSCLRSCRCPDCLLYAGVVEYAAYVDLIMLIERRERGRHRDDSAGHVSTASYSPARGPVGQEGTRADPEWGKAGKTREGYDTRCHCIGRCLPAIIWLAYDLPLERWCLKCGRCLPRPFDRKFLPAVNRDVPADKVAEMVA